MNDKSKLMDELSSKVTEKIIERLKGGMVAFPASGREDCTNGHTCGEMHSCTSNDFGCDSFVCEHDFAG